MTEARLSDNPDWGYLLREFYELYRFLPSGGSVPIRAHQRVVREAISRTIKENAEIRLREPNILPVTQHLRRSLDQGKSKKSTGFIRSLEAVSPSLTWQYGYEKVPKGLERSYGFTEITGPNGPVITRKVILGLVLFAPGCTYPTHAHDGISESYVCLSGAVSENNHGVFAPGSLIYNPPNHLHRITVSDRNPSLLAWAWIGDEEKLAGQKMVFSRKPKS
jgi:dimethylpropiothetin dethiomethylase